ncbi:MAG: chloride channel protein [Pseudomonadota bacterium]
MLRVLRAPWDRFKRLYATVAYVRLAVLGVLVGIASGIGAILFFLGIEFAKHYILGIWSGMNPPTPAGEGLGHLMEGHGDVYRPWVIVLATTATGLLTGFLVQRFLPNSFLGVTDGTDAMIKAFHRGKGSIAIKAPLIKGLMSILTIGSGGSAGREGPISQIGAGIGSFLAHKLKLTTKERRLLMLAGAAGGLGAVFRAPLGGALTAIEVAYREDFEAEAMLPAVLSSVVAYSIFALVFGTDPMFGIPSFNFSNFLELPVYLVLALTCAVMGRIYVSTFRLMKYGVFLKISERIGPMWTTALGGLLVGLFSIIYTPILSDGYGWLEDAILGELSIVTMLTIAIGKTLSTAMTLGSGMSGGMFAPALFVGGMTGGVVGFTAQSLYPDLVHEPGSYVLVGMAAFFASIAHAPIGPIIMVCELTQGYGLLTPLMLSSAICVLLNRKVSLYENQVENKFESPAHASDVTVNLLEKMTVRDCYHRGIVPVLEEGTTLKGLTNVIAGTSISTFPVRNAQGQLTGLLAVSDVRSLLYEDALFDLVIVRDLMKPITRLLESDDLYTALLYFVEGDANHLPVVDVNDQNKVLGELNRADVFKAYRGHLKGVAE